MQSPPTKLMEDHRDAYFFWKELGLQGLPCVHVDAHLDLSNLKAPQNQDVPEPHINCGNYLLPALHEGLVSSLVWVIPDHLPGDQELLDWCRQELQNWLHLDLADYMSLRYQHGAVVGSVLGLPLTVCFSDAVPQIDGPVLLDIDIDYFLTPVDDIWQTPMELAGRVAHLESAAITIAYSLLGGYTPPRHRYLGPLVETSLREPEQAAEVWLALQGSLERAEELESGLLVQPIDRLCGALMRSKFEEAREILREIRDPVEAAFMNGMLCFREGRHAEATGAWRRLLDSEILDPGTELYLRTLCGRAYLAAQQPAEAEAVLVCSPGRQDPEILSLLARAQRAGGAEEQAAKTYRKAIKLAPDRLETVNLKLELAELYLQTGHHSLADRLLQQVMTGPTPGFMKLQAEALNLKLALGKRA